MMKKILMLLVGMIFCATSMVEAQQYFIPKYKGEKVKRDFVTDNPKRKWTITFGGTYNMAFGMTDRIALKHQDDVVTYPRDTKLSGASALLGVGYKANEHIVAGVESGALFQDNGIAMPFYGTFNYYYGPATVQHRYRFFNYLHLGPQFYFEPSSTKTIGAMAGIGGGMRLVVGQTGKIDFRVGYQLNLRRPVVNTSGSYDIPASQVDYKQFTHVLQVGMAIMLF
ncbi:MAG: hypothetical protein IKV18_08665 [Alistipes sp.]|nr:hypothetical protein [Alistipes sp.]